jgi:hypothetical protein
MPRMDLADPKGKGLVFKDTEGIMKKAIGHMIKSAGQ